MRWIPVLASLALIALGLNACQTTGSLPQGMSPSEATWRWGSHAVPRVATINGYNRIFTTPKGSTDTYWIDEVVQILKTDVKVPVVIWIHGCRGPDWWNTENIRTLLLAAGYAVVAPDSFARPGRSAICDGDKKATMRYRFEEVDFALERLRELPWVDHSRIILAGFSEGGVTAALYSGGPFQARIILGWVCASSDRWWVGIRGSRKTPVLTIVGDKDNYYQTPSKKGHDCGEHFVGRPRSRSIVIENASHMILSYRQTEDAIVEFLKTVN